MGNRRVRVMWSDLNGLAHGRYVPEWRLGEHGHHAVTTLTMGIDREILPIDGYAADVGFPDLATVPLVETRRNGWEPDTDVAIADLLFHGQPLALSPRCALQRAIDGWHELGYEPLLGYEMEYYVLDRDPAAPGGAKAMHLPGHRVYGVGLGGVPTPLLFDMYDAAEGCTLQLEGMLSEFHPGQMELNMTYGPAMDAADRAFICKEMTREVAWRHGYVATYMGRPLSECVGSGLHINFSLRPLKGNGNSFDDPIGKDGISTLCRQALGGLLHHHEGTALMCAPLVNSYKRLIPGVLAGYWANWGLDNRISTYRIPDERGQATRIENRMPCASASPYLAAAVMLNAALLGARNNLDCGEPQVGDADAEPNTERHTPESLEGAIKAFEDDAVLHDALGADLVRAYIALRRYELERWNSAGIEFNPETVSDWELEQYLPFY